VGVETPAEDRPDRRLLNADALAQSKDGVRVINVACGELVIDVLDRVDRFNAG